MNRMDKINIEATAECGADENSILVERVAQLPRCAETMCQHPKKLRRVETEPFLLNTAERTTKENENIVVAVVDQVEDVTQVESVPKTSPSVFSPTIPPSPHNCTDDMSPDAYFHIIFESRLGFIPKLRPTLSFEAGFFPEITEENLAAYDMDVVRATRDEDISTLRCFHSDGRPLRCCNRFGESLLHMACRRGFTDMVKFFVEEAGLSVRVTDDCGRTPMHDALWCKDIKFHIVDLLLRTDPVLLLITDKRGSTPFAYARREYWGVWRQFLFDRATYLDKLLGQDDLLKNFHAQT